MHLGSWKVRDFEGRLRLIPFTGRPSVVFIGGRYTTIMPTGALQGLVVLFP